MSPLQAITRTLTSPDHPGGRAPRASAETRRGARAGNTACAPRRRGAAGALGLFALLAQACAGVEPDELGVELVGSEAPADATPLGAGAHALDGRIRYQSNCTPFNAALLERSMFYARTVVGTPAFEQCVRNTLAAQYVNCEDPHQGLPLATQIDRAMQILRNADNHLTFSCEHTPGDGWAHYQGHGTSDEHAIGIGDANDASYPDWVTLYGVAPGTADDYLPWNFRAATMVHEFAHTHDYGHMDPGCLAPDGCTLTECRWTRRCGGSGAPPAGMTIATAGAARQEFCSVQRFGVDDAYYSRGEPSLPYIVGSCAGRLVEESHEACGKATAPGACSDWSALRLLTAWTGTESQEQPDSAPCGCFEDPRKVVALRTSAGRAVTAMDGGGGALRTDWTTATGAWQWFQLIDNNNNGALLGGDDVQLKTHFGPWVQGTYSSSAFAPTVHRIFRASGTGPIGHGARITLGNRWTNFSTGVSAWRYAYASPTQLTSTSGSGAAENVFTLERPRRDTLVRLQAESGWYVRVNGTGAPMLAWSNLGGPTALGGTPEQQAEGAFWLIDHNGGGLVSGDTVSFEALYGDSYLYLSASGAGQVGVSNAIAAASRFVIGKVGGSGAIQHGDTITVRVPGGNYLTANLPAAGARLTTAGATVGSSQRFGLRLVSQHDRPRPTW
jgi:hypothetical protein